MEDGSQRIDWHCVHIHCVWDSTAVPDNTTCRKQESGGRLISLHVRWSVMAEYMWIVEVRWEEGMTGAGAVRWGGGEWVEGERRPVWKDVSYVFNFRWIKIPRKISPLVRDNSAEIYPLPVFSAEGHREKFWHGQGCPLFDVVHPAFSVPTMAPLTLQGSLKERLSWRVTCPNHASLHPLTVVIGGSCGSRGWRRVS